MHIPDGYLSPTTCAALGAGMTPVWYASSRRVAKVVKTRSVPLLALGAAYCFVVMMFNVPVPDGTTAHAVGGVLVAVLLGPWAAVLAVSTALLIQALFFGDGGVLAYGANCFNMAFVLPVTGYLVYRVVAGRAPLTSPRRALAAGVGAYVGLNLAALCMAVEFGLQPALFHDGNGTPLYAPFPMSQTIPAIVGAHLAIAGVVEFVLTAGVIRYLQRANVPVLRLNHRGIPDDERASRAITTRWAAIGLAAMVLLVPLGLLASGSAFGEDGGTTVWHNAVLNGYDFAGDSHPVVGYILSAIVGAVVIAGVIVAVSKLAQRARRRADPVTEPTQTTIAAPSPPEPQRDRVQT